VIVVARVAAGIVCLQAFSVAAQTPGAKDGLQPIGLRAAVGPRTESAPVRGSAHPAAETTGREGPARPSRSFLSKRLTSSARVDGSDGWFVGITGITLALAICGGVVAAARHFSSRGSAGEIQVVARTSLSPKHTVYLLRVGRRSLLVGAGPQGTPSLICELDDLAEIESHPRQGEDA
jgi:hypothetical protein